MNKREQKAIETAADNCEVLRARLAKYEDAEGRPVSTLAEQAWEIERLRLNIAEYNEHERCYQSEIAALKAQPSGVVQWPDADEIMQMAFEEGQPSEDASGYYFELEEFDLFIQRLMGEVARLNSSPVSAGGVDERAAFEAWYLGHFYMGDKQCGLEWLSTEPCGGYRHQHPAEQWIVWQARAALSAPSHGEQVRHMVMEGVTVERDVFGTIHIKSGDFDFIQIRYQYPYTDNSGTWKLAERIVALLAAAPAAPAADAWIPVSDRLPEVESRLDQECRVGTRSIAPLNVSAAVLVFDGEKVRSTRLEWFDGCLPLPYCITHWMPLPAAPIKIEANRHD